MKLLTLNTHSLQGEDYPEKRARFVRAVLDLRPDQRDGLRIDYIWRSEAVPAARSQVVFQGAEAVSDHFGVLLETKEETL